MAVVTGDGASNDDDGDGRGNRIDFDLESAVAIGGDLSIVTGNGFSNNSGFGGRGNSITILTSSESDSLVIGGDVSITTGDGIVNDASLFDSSHGNSIDIPSADVLVVS